MAHAHPVAELRTDIGAGRGKSFKGGLFFLLRAMDSDKYAGGFTAWRKDDVGDIAGGDTRIGEFSFQHRADLFGEGVGDSVAVIRSSSLLGHKFLGERLRISKIKRLT